MTVLRAFPAIFRVALAGLVAYRAEMVIWVLTATVPLVMLALWNAAAEAGPLGSFGQTEIARYFTTTLIVRQLTGSWIVWELNWQIRKGDLSPKLLRPMNPLVYNLAETLAALPFRIVVLAPMVGALLLWRDDIAFWPGWERAVAFFLSTALAFAVSWLVQVIFGMIAFWWDQSLGLFSAWFAVWGFFSGYFVPVPLLPGWVRSVSPYLPFHASLGAPVDLAVGVAPLVSTLGMQAAWTMLLGGLAVWMWRRGIRRYGAVGA